MSSQKQKWIPLPFTKHKGKTFPQIAFHDPSYIFWAKENDIFDRGPLKSQLEEVEEKICNIRIPGDNKDCHVRYCVNFQGKFDYFRVCRKEDDYFKDRFFYDTKIDCSFPHSAFPGDRGGCRRFMQSVKNLILGSKTRLTKKVCESFFDSDHFDECRSLQWGAYI